MKNIFLSLLFVAVVFILSGCSLVSLQPQKKSPSPSDSTPEVFNSKTEIGSLWKTSDGGHTFEVKSQIDEKTIISKANILSIAYHPKKQKTIYVSSAESGIFKTENAGEKWDSIVFPPKKIYSFIVDKNDPDNRMFASGSVGNWGKIFRTKDGGKNWEDVYTEPGQQTNVTALSQHFRDNNVIFAGTSAGTVVKSVNAGDTWRNVGDKVDGLVSDIAFDSKNGMWTYLLVYNSKLYHSKNGGDEWLDWEEEKPKEVQEIQKRANEAEKSGNKSLVQTLRKQASDLNTRNSKNKRPGGIVSIAADPVVPGVIFAGTMSTGLFISTDYGKYWDSLNIIESAKKFPIRSIARNPENPKELVFVSGRAFYKTVDLGASWAVTGLNVDRDAAFVSYDPFDSNYMFIGLRKF